MKPGLFVIKTTVILVLGSNQLAEYFNAPQISNDAEEKRLNELTRADVRVSRIF